MKQESLRPHRRYNPLTDEWILVSPHRAQRPWQGQVDSIATVPLQPHDPHCYLCPGNSRNTGIKNPNYSTVFVFDNDFPALTSDLPSGETLALASSLGSLFKSQSERGICKVICFSPQHHLTLAELDSQSALQVVKTWKKEYLELGALDFIQHVQIFENKGSMMGCSNPHPHGQIWAQEHVPTEPAKKNQTQKKYWDQNQKSLLVDYIKEELRLQDRVVFETTHFACVVPYWAQWPFETLLTPKREVPHLGELTEDELLDFSECYPRIVQIYNALFECSVPYSAGIHQAPTDGKSHPYWQMHTLFFPPLLRSATVRKFMVGYEMLGEAQRDLTPEQAAERLRLQIPKISLKMGNH